MREFRDDTADDRGAHVGLGRAEGGVEGESIGARLLHDGLDHELLTQHTPGGKPQGIDLESIDPDGRVVITEVKWTDAERYRPPHTTRNVADRQMDPEWTIRNVNDGGQIEVEGADALGEAPDQLGRQLIQVDVPSDTITVWRLRDDGRVAESTPEQIWRLADFDDRTNGGHTGGAQR